MSSMVVRDDESGEDSSVPFARFADRFLSARAVTYNIVQATTLRGPVAIPQCDHKNPTNRHKLAGPFRGTARRLVSVKSRMDLVRKVQRRLNFPGVAALTVGVKREAARRNVPVPTRAQIVEAPRTSAE